MTRIDIAKGDLRELTKQGAPRLVIEAGELAVACAIAGVSPPRDAYFVLTKYQQRQQAQNRYGQ